MPMEHRNPVKSVIAVFVVVALLLTNMICAPVAMAAGPSEASLAASLAQVKENFKEAELPINLIVIPNGGTQVAYITDAMTYVNSENANGSWTDVNYADTTSNRNGIMWQPYIALQRMMAMSAGYNQIGNAAYHNPAVVDAIERALKYWDQVKPHSTNWWENDVGRGQAMGYVGIFMDGVISQDALDICIAYNAGTLNPTGANGAWYTANYIMKAVVSDNDPNQYTEIQNGISTMAQTLSIDQTGAATEAVQVDDSFWCHGSMLYSEGYGQSLFITVAFWVRMTTDTDFALPQSTLDSIMAYVLDGTRWMIRGDYGLLYLGYRPYSTTSGTFNYASALIPSLQTMVAADKIHSAAYQKLIDNIEGNSNDNGLSGNKYFWRSDLISQMRPTYGIVTKMSSNKVIGGEFRSDQYDYGNTIEWNAAGATAISVNNHEYDDLLPAFDWFDYPGTTAPYEVLPAPTTSGIYSTHNNAAFVGGVSDGTNGAGAFTLNMHNTTAQKGYFYFDNEMVCLGAGITSTENVPVHTTVNQAIAKDNASVDGVTVPAGSDGVSYTNPKWAYNDQVGYVFPQNSTVKVSNKNQTANYSGKDPVTKQVFSLYFDHGVNPSNAGYEYIVVPAQTASQVEAYSQNIPVTVVANTTDVQAVRNDASKQTQVIFYKAGSLEYKPGYTVTANQPCLMMIDENGSVPKVTVSNPVTPGLIVKVTLSGTVYGTLYGQYTLPAAPYLGQSLTQVLTDVPFGTGNITASSFLPDSAPNNAIDKDSTNEWHSDNDEYQWVDMDLGDNGLLLKDIKLDWGDDYAKQYIIQTSQDDKNWSDFKIQWSGDGGTDEYPVPYTPVKYVRILMLQSSGQNGYSLKNLTFQTDKNLALGQPTNASGYNVISGINLTSELAVDGQTTQYSRWAGQMSDTAWWQVDLGQVQPVGTVRIFWESTYSLQYKIQVSDDGNSWTDAYATTADSTGGNQAISLGGIQARYVRMQSIKRNTTSYGTSIYEFEVYSDAGVPAPSPSYGGRTNLALNKPVTVDSSYTGMNPQSATDGNELTRWASARENSPYVTQRWAYVDLGSEQMVDEVDLDWESATSTDYLVQVSDNASDWNTVNEVKKTSSQLSDTVKFPPVQAQYVRVIGLPCTKYGISLYEFKVFGDFSAGFAKTEQTMNKGDTGEATLNVLPYSADDEITFTSYNPNAVKITGTPVYDGTGNATVPIQAVNGGYATLIARHSKGPEYSLCYINVNIYKTDLENAIAKAQLLDQNQYTTDSWKDADIDNVLTQSTMMDNSSDATQNQVDAQTQKLLNSINQLVERADPDSLNQTISTASSLSPEDYTSDSWAVLDDAMSQGRRVANDLNATQSQMDAAEQAIQDAIDSLVALPKKPVFSIAGGTYVGAQAVSISCGTPGAVIYYTTDGTTPTESSQKYSAPLTVTSSETIKAIAVAESLSSSVSSADYTIRKPDPQKTEAPAFSIPAGRYVGTQNVSITCNTPGAVIYYTTDGTTPTESSKKYSAPIAVSSSETIKAIALADGRLPSDVVSASYTIADQAIPPVINDDKTNISFDLSGAEIPSEVTSVSIGVTSVPDTGAGSSLNSEVEKLLEENSSFGTPARLVVYNLSMLDQSGNPIESFTGKIKIKIPIPDGMSGNLHVVWYDSATGSLQDMNAVQENGFLVFETTHFSYYAVTQLSASKPSSGNPTNPVNPTNPKTGDNEIPFLPVALLGIGFSAKLIVSRRKNMIYRRKRVKE